MKATNKIILTLASTAMLFSTTSCLKDEPIVDWSVIEPVIELADADHLQATSSIHRGETVEFEIIVNYTIDYASKVTAPITVGIAPDNSLLDARSASYGEEVLAFPEGSYNLPESVTIEEETQRDTVLLSVNTKDFTYGRTYCLPVVITNVPEGYITSGNFNYLYLQISIAEPEISITADDEKNYSEGYYTMSGVKPGDELTFKIEANFTYRTANADGVSVPLMVDNELIEGLNSSLGDDKSPYLELPAGSYSGLPESTTIEAGKTNSKFDVVVNTTGFTAGETYILPIVIHSDALSEGYAVGTDLIYLKIEMESDNKAE